MTDSWTPARVAHAKGKRDKVAAIKLDAGCADCGYREHSEALQFDHRPGEVKLFGVAHRIHRAWAKTLAEIEKCDVVCANCHAIRTAERRTGVRHLASNRSA